MTTMMMMSWPHPTTATTASRDRLCPCLPPHRQSTLRVDINVASYRRHLPFMPSTKTLTSLHPCCCQINPCSNFTSRHHGLQQILSLRPWRGKTTATTTTMSRHRIFMQSKTLFFYGCKLDLNFSFGQRLFFVQ
jgi:hypothetical protein